MHQSKASTKAHSAEMVEAYLVREEIGRGDGGNNNGTLLSSLVLDNQLLHRTLSNKAFYRSEGLESNYKQYVEASRHNTCSDTLFSCKGAWVDAVSTGSIKRSQSECGKERCQLLTTCRDDTRKRKRRNSTYGLRDMRVQHKKGKTSGSDQEKKRKKGSKQPAGRRKQQAASRKADASL
ncbi:hypothetical protein HBI23_254210 [Parastagonospora nodorum]|nr:hypothetical protein HBI23_254210 [Parastagonospora nodorum]KAH5619301.1 hypothetical protein HBI51_252620 [Parastagonospora nodorum]KAH5983371.1 hypothetical protein HBI84_248140 [Parastagonospora nodorum]KAH6133488.1 hypothetical protein HBI68_253710 [Parastagonospora nodorum]KAH6383627.1 hypothetical protein HBI60_255990 [Parastagonospora nodorum]